MSLHDIDYVYDASDEGEIYYLTVEYDDEDGVTNITVDQFFLVWADDYKVTAQVDLEAKDHKELKKTLKEKIDKLYDKSKGFRDDIESAIEDDIGDHDVY